jgi:OOP family OmpA-OmpF porin
MEQTMKKKLLCCALLGAVAMAQTASAQDFDDRWYVTGGIGYNVQDSDRNTEDTLFGTLGFGKFVTPNWSIDGEFNYQNPQIDGTDLNWTQWGVSVDARYHFIKEGKNWWPYIRAGLGVYRAEEEFFLFPGPGLGEREESHLMANLGVGLQADYDRYAIRAEIGTRVAFDDTSVQSPNSDRFADLVGQLTFVWKLGDRAAAPAPVEPVVPQQTCADLDDDGDGVNNCNDRCPNSVAGQTIGADGCEVKVTIDLRGVNFDFDKATLRPDAIAILDEAVSILQRYPQMRFELAGHTDECGSDAYNQRLSERRARVVYDYLIGKGIDAGRISGPNAYGETRPIEQLGDAFPGCKSETNRRTELNVLN